MIGLVLASHGGLAAVMAETAAMIVGEPSGLAVVGLEPGQGPEQFRQVLVTAIDTVDEGSGVLVLTDLLGGTPANQAILQAVTDERVAVLTGLNLPMLLEGLTRRNELELKELVATLLAVGRDGITEPVSVLRKSLGS